jgi:hypothetical protein
MLNTVTLLSISFQCAAAHYTVRTKSCKYSIIACSNACATTISDDSVLVSAINCQMITMMLVVM